MDEYNASHPKAYGISPPLLQTIQGENVACFRALLARPGGLSYPHSFHRPSTAIHAPSSHCTPLLTLYLPPRRKMVEFHGLPTNTVSRAEKDLKTQLTRRTVNGVEEKETDMLLRTKLVSFAARFRV